MIVNRKNYTQVQLNETEKGYSIKMASALRMVLIWSFMQLYAWIRWFIFILAIISTMGVFNKSLVLWNVGWCLCWQCPSHCILRDSNPESKAATYSWWHDQESSPVTPEQCGWMHSPAGTHMITLFVQDWPPFPLGIGSINAEALHIEVSWQNMILITYDFKTMTMWIFYWLKCVYLCSSLSLSHTYIPVIPDHLLSLSCSWLLVPKIWLAFSSVRLVAALLILSICLR